MTPKPYAKQVEDANDTFVDDAATKLHKCFECGLHSIVKIQDAFDAGADFVLKNPPPEWQKVSVWDENEVKKYALSFMRNFPNALMHPFDMIVKGAKYQNSQQRQITDLSTRELLQNEKVRELIDRIKAARMTIYAKETEKDIEQYKTVALLEDQINKALADWQE